LGEVVHLIDGTTVEGDLLRTNDGWVVTEPGGKVTVVTTAQVKSIELKKVDSSSTADQRLASLRRAVANQNDIKQIIERFQSFINQNPNTPAGKSAADDLAQWQERLDKGLVRAGDKWVTPDQLAELQAKTLDAANQLRSLITAGKLADASAGVDRELTISPQSPSLLYLKGLISLKQTQLVPARDAFKAAAAALPDSAAIHNNLAVILWKQRSQMQSLAEYDKAMLAQPENRVILDNVTEAFHALPVEHQKSDLTKRVVEHYKDQEAALEKTMAAQGFYRWGSDWLNEKEFNKVQAAQKAVQDKIDSLKKDMDDIQAQLVKLAREIQDDKQVQQAIASQSVQMDPTTGRTYQLPLPQRYYDLDRDIRSLQAEQVLKQRQWVDIQKLQQQQTKNMPVPHYSGIQKPFDVESMPGGRPMTSTAAPPPATAPTAQTPSPAPAVRPSSPTPPKPPTPKAGGGVDFSPAPSNPPQ
jgi:tetratricopeptide (TPR) repeat protein